MHKAYSKLCSVKCHGEFTAHITINSIVGSYTNTPNMKFWTSKECKTLKGERRLINERNLL